MNRNMRFLLSILTLLMLALVACEPDPPAIAFTELPDGDAGSGEKLFLQSTNDAPTCASCHTIDATNGVGPGLGGYGGIAGERVSGESAEEYTYWSIVAPSRHIVQGFSNVMYSDYDEVYEEQDLADLMAYLLEL